jgi:hypothetical protein
VRNGLGLALALLVVVLVFQYAGRFAEDDPVTIRGDDRERPVAAAIAAFRPDEIVEVLPPDAIPAIHDPELVPVRAVGEDLDDDDKVIGVVIDGEARAYPIRVLSAHEIVNDEIHGRPIAVTW